MIDGSVVGRFRFEYLRLPSDHFYDKKWKKFTTKQVLAAVKMLDDATKAKLRLTTTTTANKHIIFLIEYWDFLALHAKIPRGLDNPFCGHFTAKPRGRAARDEHPMWPKDLDKEYFTSPVYAGCKSIFRRAIPAMRSIVMHCFGCRYSAALWACAKMKSAGVWLVTLTGSIRKLGGCRFSKYAIPKRVRQAAMFPCTN